MKVIKPGPGYPGWSEQLNCMYCDSLLKVDYDDIKTDEYDTSSFRCPVCYRENILSQNWTNS